jgi:hypothetical protein
MKEGLLWKVSASSSVSLTLEPAGSSDGDGSRLKRPPGQLDAQTEAAVADAPGGFRPTCPGTGFLGSHRACRAFGLPGRVLQGREEVGLSVRRLVSLASACRGPVADPRTLRAERQRPDDSVAADYPQLRATLLRRKDRRLPFLEAVRFK